MSIISLPPFNIWKTDILENEEYQETLPLFNKKSTNEFNYDKHKYIYQQYNDIVKRANNLNTLSSKNQDIIKLAIDCTKLQKYINDNEIYTLPSKNNFNFSDIWITIENIMYSWCCSIKRILPSCVKYKHEWDDIEDEHIQFKIIENKYENDDTESINSNYDIEKNAGLSDYDDNDDNEELNGENITSQYPPFGRGSWGGSNKYK
jgi:hypothetical protein